MLPLLDIATLFNKGIRLPFTDPVAIFFTVMALILVVPLLLQKLRIPNIVGLIAAGVAIGPHCLDLLDRDASFEVFGQVGILYLMFLAGVEIDMLNLRRNWKHGLRFGLLSFALPLAGGILVSRCLLGFTWPTALLISSMLSSHTLISYPLVARFGLSGERSSVVAVCGTIVAVLLSLLLLAEVVDLQAHGAPDAMRPMLMVCSIAVFAAATWYGLSAATRWFFRRFNDRVLQYVFIMAEMLLAALFSQLIGLEGILGAFYAGLVLNRFIPSRSGLMARIEFVGSAIFIPYFLIGVGMMMDVGVIFSSGYVAWLALCMTAVALGCKWLSAFAAQRSMGLCADDRRLIFGLTSGKAAATIAATIIGFHVGLINEDVMNAAVIMILLCCAVASVVTERAAKGLRMRIAERELNDPRRSGVSAESNPRQLVAVANPVTAAGLLRLAFLMRSDRCKEHITALFVRSSDDSTAIGMGRTAMKEASAAATAVEMPMDEIERFDVNTVAGITNVMRERHCTEIVIGLHRRSNVVDTFFGSMTEQLLHATDRMIIMSRCFVPLNTLSRIVAYVPPKAEYETGFRLWTDRLGTLAEHTGTSLRLLAHPDTIRHLKPLLAEGAYHAEIAFEEIASWDDFITASARIDDDDDLFVVVSARPGSLSFSSDVEDMPHYLSRYFARHNLLVVYPSQFGGGSPVPYSSMADLGTINQHTT